MLRTKHKLDRREAAGQGLNVWFFDWRVPESHIYWSVLGFEKGKTEEEIIKLRRVQNDAAVAEKGIGLRTLLTSSLSSAPI